MNVGSGLKDVWAEERINGGRTDDFVDCRTEGGAEE